MRLQWLLLTMLATGCVIPETDEPELDVVEEALMNCPDDDVDCNPYPTVPQKKPDLVPVFLAAPDGRCNWDGYHLRFGVKNAGNAASSASRVWLGFSASYGRWYSVPSLAAGASWSWFESGLRLDPNCYFNNCTAKVTADYGDLIAESNETNNNSASRKCDFHF